MDISKEVNFIWNIADKLRGAYTSDKSTDGWIKVEIPIEYTSKSRKPTHIIVSCASSMLGDYFTGSTDSKLWIDDVQLEY